MTGKRSRIQAEESSADSVLLLDVLWGVLQRCAGQRWFVRTDEVWCSVVPPAAVSRQHGWKLHVSATPLSAPLVLARVAEVLVRHDCSFKFATDIRRVRDLVDPWQDRAAGGKFITAYPRDDEQIRVLADELDKVTSGMAGPRVLSDRQLRAGSLVHYRYGQFKEDELFTDEGQFEPVMTGPDGSQARDERLAWFSPPKWAVSPFPEPAVAVSVPKGHRLLAGRFRMTGALRQANKGGVYQAVDEQTGAPVVIKQARAYVGAGLDGGDVRDLRRHEARMLEVLAPLSLFPAHVLLFEEQGDLFLAEEEIPGATLDSWAADRHERDELVLDDVIRVGRQLVEAVRSVHDAGLLLVDLKPTNVIVTSDDRVRLLDAEMLIPRGQRRVRGYTPGYAAPELAVRSSARPDPQTSVDCFSLGVTLFCLAAGGLDADWVFGRPGTPRSGVDRRLLLSQIAAGRPALLSLIEVIVGLTETDPSQRWSLEQAEKFFASIRHLTVACALPAEVTMPADRLDRLLSDGVEHLRRGMTPNERDLWRPGPARFRHDPCDAWRGASGVLATLTRAARLLDSPALSDTVAQTAAWIDDRLYDVPRILPGLSFGRAGTAWALHDAGQFLDDRRLKSRARELAGLLATQGPNPDVTTGLSGAGLAGLYLWQTAGDPGLLHRALECADSVLAAAVRSGADWLWPVPVALESGSGPVRYSCYGFAHGVAGVGTFLLSAAHVAGTVNGSSNSRAERFMEAALRAGETLLRGAGARRGAPVWPMTAGGSDYGDGVETTQWCNGPVGVGTFLVRLWAATGQQRFLDVAVRCAPGFSDDWAVSMGACCGLSGSGHFLLDLADFTGDSDFHKRAEQMAYVIGAQAYAVDGLHVTCRPDHRYAYAEGTAGVVDFLLRLHHGGRRPWLPECT